MKNEGKTTSAIEERTRKIPSGSFLAFAFASMALSAGLAISGRVRAANFVGQWVPSLLILGTYNKIAKTFTAPYDEEQERVLHGDRAAMEKERMQGEEARRTSRPQVRP